MKYYRACSGREKPIGQPRSRRSEQAVKAARVKQSKNTLLAVRSAAVTACANWTYILFLRSILYIPLGLDLRFVDVISKPMVLAYGQFSIRKVWAAVSVEEIAHSGMFDQHFDVGSVDW